MATMQPGEKEIVLQGDRFVLSMVPYTTQFNISKINGNKRIKIGEGRFTYDQGKIYIERLIVKNKYRGKGFLQPIAEFVASKRPKAREVVAVWAFKDKPNILFRWKVQGGKVVRVQPPKRTAKKPTPKRPRRRPRP